MPRRISAASCASFRQSSLRFARSESLPRATAASATWPRQLAPELVTPRAPNAGQNANRSCQHSPAATQASLLSGREIAALVATRIPSFDLPVHLICRYIIYADLAHKQPETAISNTGENASISARLTDADGFFGSFHMPMRAHTRALACNQESRHPSGIYIYHTLNPDGY